MSVTVEKVVKALQKKGRGWHRYEALRLRATRQAVSAALSHARDQNMVECRPVGPSNLEWRLRR